MAHRFHTAAKASSTARGYGKAHRDWVKANKPAWIGRRCPGKGPTLGKCHTILVETRINYRTRKPEPGMHADHGNIPASQGGLPTGYLCPECNREDGARRGNRKQRAIRQPMPRRHITPLNL